MARMSADQWSEKMARLLKREVIGRELESGSGVSVAKSRAREFAQGAKLRQTIEQLLNSELIVEEKRAKLAAQIGLELRNKFPELVNLSLVLVGSGIHGGSVVRELTENYEDTDLDWGVIADDGPITSEDERRLIVEYVNQEIKKLAPQFGLPDDFRGCPYYNAKKLYCRTFPTVNHCYDYLWNGPSIRFEARNPLMLAFQPSFPDDTLERQRDFVLDALHRLWRAYPATWQERVDEMVKEWKEHHTLKEKHLMRDSLTGPWRSKKLAWQVTGSAPDLMARGFQALLESTKEN